MAMILRWLWHLAPGNPMVVRIVQGGSRRQRDMWVRTAYLGILIFLVIIGLLSGGGLGGEMGMTEMAKAGSGVFAVIAYGQVILVCLLAPLFMAGAIAHEQSNQTYDILLTTPLSNLQIVLGSLLGRLFFILALLVSGLPLFAVLLIFGGVPIHSVFVAFSVAALTALTVGSVAVTMSVLRAGGRKAVFVFVIAVAAYLVAAYALDVVLLRKLTATPKTTTWLTPLHPLLVLEASLNSANYRPPEPEMTALMPPLVGFYLGKPFAAFAILSTLVSLALAFFSALILRRIGQGEWRLLSRLRAMAGVLPGVERRRVGRTVWQNPVAWREANTRGNGPAAVAARWAFAAVAVMVGVVLLGLYHFDALPSLTGTGGVGAQTPDHVFLSTLLIVLVIEIAVVCLVALYMSAGSVSREREDGTLDLLLATPITPRQYIWGKLRGLVSFLVLLISVPVVTVALVSAYAVVGWMMEWDQATYLVSLQTRMGRVTHEPLLMLPETALLLAMMLVPFVAVCVAAGMWFSLKAKGVLGAVVQSVAVLGVVATVVGFCGWNAAEHILFVGPILNAFSPATNVFMVVDPWHRVIGFIEGQPESRLVLAFAAACAAGVYCIIVYALIVDMIRNFDQTVRRLSGAG